MEASNPWVAIASVAASCATIVAIIVGGWFALFKLRIFRELKPHMTVTQEVTHRRISNGYVHVIATACLFNGSKVAVEIRRCAFQAYALSPLSDEMVESLYEDMIMREVEDTRKPSIWWPLLDEVDRFWEGGELIIEPGSRHFESVEFVLTGDVKSVLIYGYFRNTSYTDNSAQARGWEVTTPHDIVSDDSV